MNETEVELQNQRLDSTTHSSDDYDPHLERNVPNATTDTQTLIHLMKGTLGAGIMALPQAYLNAGYAAGVMVTVFVTLISGYCFSMLAKSEYILCKRHRLPVLTYPVSMKMALEDGPTPLRCLSKFAIPFIDGFMLLNQVGICCIYVVFVSENIRKLVDVEIHLDVKIYIVILLIPFILLSCIRNLKLFAPFSLFSNVITFVGVGFIFYYFFRDGIAGPSERVAFNSFANFPSYFCTTLFAINSITMIIPIENNMKTPQSFNKIIAIAMTIICVLYSTFGFTGYLRYGESCKGSVTLNVGDKEVLAKCIPIIFAVAVFISYGLQIYVPVSIIWGTYLSKRLENSHRKLYYELAVRISIVLLTSAVAAAIPFIGLFCGLVGALCISMLGLVCPAVMEICVLYNDKLSVLTIIKNLFIFTVGIVSLVVGTYMSVRDIVAEQGRITVTGQPQPQNFLL